MPLASLLLPLLLLSLAFAQPVPPPAPQPNPAEPPIYVMTFNIRYGTANDGPNAWPKRRHQVFDLIQDNGKRDIIGLQEALKFQIDEILEASRGSLASFGVGRDDGKEKGEYAPILYRPDRLQLDPDPSTRGTQWLSETPDTPGSKSWGNSITRIFTFAKFRLASSGSELWVYNTHFDHASEPARRRSAAQLAHHIADHARQAPVILTGDFNCGETSNAIQYLTAKIPHAFDEDTSPNPAPLLDSFRVRFPDSKDTGTFQDFGKSADQTKIDYIFISPSRFEVEDASIIRKVTDGVYPSDHWPVTATLRLHPSK